MAGRYGPDQLNIALILGGVVCGLIADLTRFLPLTIVAYALIIYALVRLLSRKIEKRRRRKAYLARRRERIKAMLSKKK